MQNIIVRFLKDFFYKPTYEWSNDVMFDLFWMVFPTFGPMTAGLIQTQTVNVPNDSDFECRALVYHLDAAAAQGASNTLAIPNITALLNDSGSGRNLMNAALPLPMIASPDGNHSPVELPWPKIFTRNSTISLTLTNFDAAAATNNIRVAMCGRKIFSAS